MHALALALTGATTITCVLERRIDLSFVDTAPWVFQLRRSQLFTPNSGHKWILIRILTRVRVQCKHGLSLACTSLCEIGLVFLRAWECWSPLALVYCSRLRDVEIWGVWEYKEGVVWACFLIPVLLKGTASRVLQMRRVG